MYADKSLTELTKMVFEEKYTFINESKKFRGKSGKTWNFDALIKNEEALWGMLIKDWKREISITQLRQLHKAALDVPEISGGVCVCNLISDFAKDYSEQYGIQLVSRGHLISKLRSRQYDF